MRSEGEVRRPAARLRVVHPLAAVVALALLLRVIVVLATPHYVPETDAADYDRIAVSLVQDGRFPGSLLAPAGGPTAYRGPAFPFALAAAYEVSGVASKGARWEAGRLLEAVLGTIAVALVFLIAQRLWDRRTAIVAGLMAAV